VNRPRMTISVLRGLLKIADLAPAELMGRSKEEILAELGGSKGCRDYDRAHQWINAMRHWYMKKEVQP